LQAQSENTTMQSKTQIYVCVTCRAEGEPLEPKPERSGARLHASLSARAGGAFDIVPVECLSVCKRPCTVSFAAPGKWTYVYGGLLPGDAEDIILNGARLYAATPDGVIAWKQRPDALKKGVVARIPPLPLAALATAPETEEATA
jgi:predicted metal-binding protein